MEPWQMNAAAGWGALVQFMRSNRRFPEWGALVALVVGALGIFWLSPDVPPFASKEFFRSFASWAPAIIAAAGGGTFFTSKGASAAAQAFKLNTDHPAVPVTNSKG